MTEPATSTAVCNYPGCEQPPEKAAGRAGPPSTAPTPPTTGSARGASGAACRPSGRAAPSARSS